MANNLLYHQGRDIAVVYGDPSRLFSTLPASFIYTNQRQDMNALQKEEQTLKTIGRVGRMAEGCKADISNLVYTSSIT